MLGTITLNPAIDKSYVVAELKIGEVQRIKEVRNTPGGKGINVAKVASLLGEEVISTGFLGGMNGQFIKKELDRLQIKSCFYEIEEETRCCIAIRDQYGNQTELLEPGPPVHASYFTNWLKNYEELLDKCSIICASGSLPMGLEEDTYCKLIKKANSRGKKFFLDTSGKILLKSLEAKPYFIKPNMDEIKIITGKDVNDEETIIKAMKQLNSYGIEMVSVTMGSRGSYVYYENSLYKAIAPSIACVNPVGSGDAYTAGIMVGISRKLSAIDTIKLATACGALNAMEKDTGFINRDNLLKVHSQVEVIKLSK